jgi:hypothetical protein
MTKSVGAWSEAATVLAHAHVPGDDDAVGG